MQWLWVGLGGAFGSVLRFFLQGRVQMLLPGVFPIGTLAVNLIGSAAIGFVAGLLSAFPAFPQLRNFFLVGILGGFTTFSSFSLENLNLLRMGQGRLAIAYILLSNALGLALAFAGYALSKGVMRATGLSSMEH